MRIAQVSPLYESVPPCGYGGTERIVSYLTEELVRRGHEVVLFAAGDSKTRAELVPICPSSLRLGHCADPLAFHVVMLERVAQRAREFDVVHFHVSYLHFPLSRRLGLPQLTTQHGRLDLPELQCVFDEYPDMPQVSISNAQRAPVPQANFCGTVYHGLPLDLYELQARPGDYLAFLGRISPEKRLDRAIEIARRVGLRLKIAAKLDSADHEYFRREIEPLLRSDHVEFVGEIADSDKTAFLGGARCLLFPIDWPEPFGLVMIESMACGTPVVAYRHGSVPEIIDDGVTGFVVDDLDAAVRATRRAVELDRRACRESFERRFSVERMARDYLDLYARSAELRRRGRELAA
jgi:glycosyltransferase involved in cell wall biosynthesis